MAILICEIGQNHCGDMNLAKRLIELAKENGADLVKFQLYNHAKMYANHPEVPNCELSKEQAFELFDYGKQVGIEVFFSVFDVERVKWCEEIGVKRYKLGYGRRYDKELIYRVARCGKPMVVSFPHLTEVPSMNKVDFLYCIPNYPTKPDELHLSDAFSDMACEYDGFSDHTIGIDCAKIALARGAEIIEKHFTLDKTMYGSDHQLSMNPEELKELVRWGNLCKEVL